MRLPCRAVDAAANSGRERSCNLGYDLGDELNDGLSMTAAAVPVPPKFFASSARERAANQFYLTLEIP
jgi:hypothetical protein